MNTRVAKDFLISRLPDRTRLTLHRIALLVLSVALLPVASRAATFNIANGDVAGLIKAINTANSNGQPNTINLASSGTYTLIVANGYANQQQHHEECGVEYLQKASVNYGSNEQGRFLPSRIISIVI